MWYRFAQDMSVPFYRYPFQQQNDYKNRMPIKKNFKGDSQPEIDNIWQPKGKFISHKAIWNIIDELELHLEVENSLGGFYETSCDVVQKINNYLWLCEKETSQ